MRLVLSLGISILSRQANSSSEFRKEAKAGPVKQGNYEWAFR